MAASWTFGSVGIYTEEMGEEFDVKRAEIVVLDGTASTLHFFGAASSHRNITGIVIGDTDANQLKTWARAGTSQTLTAAWGSLGTHVIHGQPKFTPIRFAGATIDGTTYTPSTPIYRVEVEFVATS